MSARRQFSIQITTALPDWSDVFALGRELSSKTLTLLDRNALGQVTRFVDVAAELDRQMISQELQRDHRKNRAETIDHIRNLDNVRGEVFQLFRSVSGSYGDDRSLARLYLFNVVEVL